MALVTLSRGIGCGGMIISKLVAEGFQLSLSGVSRIEDHIVVLAEHRGY